MSDRSDLHEVNAEMIEDYVNQIPKETVMYGRLGSSKRKRSVDLFVVDAAKYGVDEVYRGRWHSHEVLNALATARAALDDLAGAMRVERRSTDWRKLAASPATEGDTSNA